MSVYLYDDGYYRDASGRVVDPPQHQGQQYVQYNQQQAQKHDSRANFSDHFNQQGSCLNGNSRDEGTGGRHRQAPPDHGRRTAEFVKERQQSLGGSKHSSSSKSRKTKSSARHRASEGIARFDGQFNLNNSNSSTQQPNTTQQTYVTQPPYGMQQAYITQQAYATQQSYGTQ